MPAFAAQQVADGRPDWCADRNALRDTGLDVAPTWIVLRRVAESEADCAHDSANRRADNDSALLAAPAAHFDHANVVIRDGNAAVLVDRRWAGIEEEVMLVL